MAPRQKKVRKPAVDNHKALLRRIILKGKYHKVLTLIEFFLRQENCPRKLREELIGLFEEALSPYYVLWTARPTVIKRFDKESVDAIQQAVQLVEKQGSDKAKKYLREASRLINEKGYGTSVSGIVSMPSNRLWERFFQNQTMILILFFTFDLLP